MTLEEAKKIAAIADTADGGCEVCVRNLIEQLQETFPEFSWIIPADYEPTEVTEA